MADTALAALPNQEMYELSYMHRANVTHVRVSPRTDFVITCSADGFLKLWKKQVGEIVPAKSFRPHMTPFVDVAVSWDGNFCCTISTDKSVKIFDVGNFDMINMLRLEYVANAIALVHSAGQPVARVAVCHSESGNIDLYDPCDGEGKILKTFSVHPSPVKYLQFNRRHDTVISVHEDGMIEYWSPTTFKFNPDDVAFQLKTSTDLFELKKRKTTARSLELSPDGQYFSMWCADRQVRVFNFRTGKLVATFDESLEVYAAIQADELHPLRMDSVEFGKRLAFEREVEALTVLKECSPINVIFDETSRCVLFSTMVGIKVMDIKEKTLLRLIGRHESERWLNVALHQGNESVTDPCLVCTAHKRQRFYLFTQRGGNEDRDVFNEKPTREDIVVATGPSTSLHREAILRTTYGDIHIKLFPDEAPKAVENFTTHAKNGYYNNLIFHRVIKGFMVQTGDPQGDGTGGESIWEEMFEDEIVPSLKFDRPFTVAMANCGPCTNGSQFFITTVPTPWLDNKHTIFGRVTKGMDVVHSIEAVKVRSEKPMQDIKIANIEVV